MEETKTLQEEYSPTVAKREKVRRVAVAMIDDFPEHPFKVKDDEEMEKLKDSILCDHGICATACCTNASSG